MGKIKSALWLASFAFFLLACERITDPAQLPVETQPSGTPIPPARPPQAVAPCDPSAGIAEVSGPESIPSDPGALTALFYQAVLWREPDYPGADGLRLALSQGNVLRAVQGLARSKEFQERISGTKDREAIISHFYQVLFGREPDPAERRTWAEGDNSLDQIAGIFACSGEFFQRAHVYRYAEEMNRLIYQAILWRDPDPAGIGWRDPIFRGDIAQVAFAIAGSDEFATDVAARRDREAIVRHLYQILLGREIDPSGFDVFVRSTSHSYPEIARILVTSAEFQAHAPSYLDALGKTRRRGQIRLEEHSPADDGGKFNALGASLFWALWAVKFDEPKLRRNLKFLAEHGFHYIRAFAQVGCPNRDGSGDGSCGPLYPWGTTNYFHGRIINPRWPDFEDQMKRLMDIAYDEYGLRIEWSIFGGIGDMYGFFGEDEPRRVIDAVLRATRGREEKVMHFQIGNEMWQTGLAFADNPEDLRKIRDLTTYLNSRTDIPVSITDPVGDDCTIARQLYAGGIAELVSYHYDRSYGDGGWASVRQPWDSCGYPFVTNDEPIGPGVSVAAEDQPHKLASAALTSFISNVGFYVYHTEAGVWGGVRGAKADLYDYDPGIGEAFLKLSSYVPADLSSWNRQDITWPGYPFQPGFGGWTSWGAPASSSAIAYAATRGKDFLVHPVGVGRYEMRAKEAMSLDVLNTTDGRLTRHVNLSAGEVLVLEGQDHYVLKGSFVDRVPTATSPFCSGGRLTDPRGYFFSLIGRREGDPAGDWVQVLERSGIPGGLPPGVMIPQGAAFFGLTQQKGAGGVRGRLFLPTDAPDENGYYSHPIDVLTGEGNDLHWAWKDWIGGPAYSPQPCGS